MHRMLVPLTAVLMGLMAFGCSSAQDRTGRETFRERLAARRAAAAPMESTAAMDLVSLPHQGMDRSYFVHVPDALKGRSGLPAVVLFHGGEGDGRKAEAASEMSIAADQNGFVVIYPNSPGQQWNDGRSTTQSGIDDVGFTAALLADAERKFGIDPNRVFAAGMSNGGMFTQRLACDAAPLFRAFGVVVANMPSDLAPNCRPARPVPMLFMNGTGDRLMPVEGGEIASMRALGAGVGGSVLSYRDTQAFWRRVNGCGPAGREAALPDRSDDGTRVLAEEVGDCRGGAGLAFFTVENGGHNWPGSPMRTTRLSGTVSQDVSATREIVAFFRRYGL